MKNVLVMRNGDIRTVSGLKIEAVPAYNLVHLRSSGRPFHPEGEGNGYVLALGAKRVYVAGDAARVFKPKVLYPYHTRFSSEDQVRGFMELMKDITEVEVRVSQ